MLENREDGSLILENDPSFLFCFIQIYLIMLVKLNPVFSKYCDYLTLLLVFSMPLLENKLSQLIVIWVISASVQKLLDLKWKFDFNLQLSLLPLLYVLYLIGIIWSGDKHAGFFAIEVKASFLVFPIIIAANRQYFKENRIKILMFFILGCFVSSIICLFVAFYQSTTFTPDGLIYNTIDPRYATWDYGGSNFRFIHLSLFLHPSYFSSYLLFSLVCCIEILRGRTFSNPKLNGFLYLSALLFLIMIYMLSSKALITCTVAVVLGYAVIFLNNSSDRLIHISIITIAGLIALIGFQNPRFKAVCELIANPKIVLGNDGDGTIVSRVHIWKSGLELIGSNFVFGVGPGDTNNELVKKYQLHGYKDPFRVNSNAHNQFLETFLDLGVIGFLLLMTILFYSFYKSVDNKNLLLFIFLFICSFNFLFESMLNVREGVVFFCFFYCFLGVLDINGLQEKSILKPADT